MKLCQRKAWAQKIQIDANGDGKSYSAAGSGKAPAPRQPPGMSLGISPPNRSSPRSPLAGGGVRGSHAAAGLRQPGTGPRRGGGGADPRHGHGAGGCHARRSRPGEGAKAGGSVAAGRGETRHHPTAPGRGGLQPVLRGLGAPRVGVPL